MENKLVSILGGLKLTNEFDVILQGTLDPEEVYPEHFFTYWNWETPRESFYDNSYSKVNWAFQIVAYSTDRTFLSVMVKEALKELERNGFIIEDNGEDISTSDKHHTAKLFEVRFLEIKGGN